MIGTVAVAGAVFGYGYMKGYNKAETVYLEEMNQALARQLKEILKQKDFEIKLALAGEREKNAITNRVNSVHTPAVSCDLPPACLQWYDDILRATGTN